MTDRDLDAEQMTLIHQLDQIEMDGDLRLKIQEMVLSWFAEQREAERRWGLREHQEGS